MFLLSRRSAFFALFVILAFAATTLLAPRSPSPEDDRMDARLIREAKLCFHLEKDDPYFLAAFKGLISEFDVKAVRGTGTVDAKYVISQDGHTSSCLAEDVAGGDVQTVSGITRKTKDNVTIELTVQLAAAEFPTKSTTTAIIIELEKNVHNIDAFNP
eukprot:GHVS01095165.1.p1 GENE.GHVS01095165.1~~GHVS01095165.1.p1  ORF type:complete len:183 (-),score=34.96 GHVS01095165.1:87-560(-)